MSITARVVLMSFVILTALGGEILPAHAASQSGNAAVALAGTATLPTFPCSGCGATGTFSGTAAGAASGNDNGTMWSAAGAGSIMASFSYSEPAPSCPHNGTAMGMGTIWAAAAGVYGTRTVTDIHISFLFSWVRTELVATITTNATVALSFDTSPFMVTVLTNATDTAVAAFVPTTLQPSLCDGSTMTAVVAGADLTLSS